MIVAVHDPLDCQVSQKLLLRNGRKLLVLHSGNSPYSDFPGGRMNTAVLQVQSQEGMRIELHREVVEEIGEDAQYMVEPQPVGTTVHTSTSGTPIFSVFYEAQYVSGTMELSPEHDNLKWVDVDTYDPASDTWMPAYEEFVRGYIDRVRASAS